MKTEDLTFIQAVVNDYDDLGFGKKIDDVTIESNDGDTKIELQPKFVKDDEVGVEIYSNGSLSYSMNYADSGFTESFAKAMTSELNV